MNKQVINIGNLPNGMVLIEIVADGSAMIDSLASQRGISIESVRMRRVSSEKVEFSCMNSSKSSPVVTGSANFREGMIRDLLLSTLTTMYLQLCVFFGVAGNFDVKVGYFYSMVTLTDKKISIA